MNLGGSPSCGSRDPIRWWIWPLILKTGGPQPSFIPWSIFAPIDVKANMQLYWHIFFINFFERASPSYLTKPARGSGHFLKGSIRILPPLQQEL